MRSTTFRDRLRGGSAIVKVLFALLAGLLVAAALRGAATPSGVTSAPRPAPTPDTSTSDADDVSGPPVVAGPGPRSSVGGVGVGFERSEAGAVAAAVSYAGAAQSWLYLADDDLTAAAEAVIATETRSDLVGRLVTDVRLLRDQLAEASGTVWYAVAPLATKVESYGPARAAVRVWVVRVLSAEGVVVPQSGWETLTFELAWDRAATGASDWRVVDVVEAEGPTPQLEAGLEPWDAAYLEQTLTGFLRVGVR